VDCESRTRKYQSPRLLVWSASARPSGDTADVPGIEISSTLRPIRQGELETVAIGHRTASVWDYIDLILPPRVGNLGAGQEISEPTP